MDLLDRLQAFITYTGLSTAAFEKAAGMGNASLSKALKEKRSIGSGPFEAIFKAFPDLNPDYIWRGTGHMLLSEEVNAFEALKKTAKLMETTISSLERLDRANQQRIAQLEIDLEKCQKQRKFVGG